MTDEHPQESADAPPPAEVPTPAPSSRGWKLAVVVLLAVAIGLGFLAAVQTSRLSAERSREASVRRVAAAMGTALQTYDYRRMDETKSNVLRLATGAFRRDYQEQFPGDLGELITSTKLTSSVQEVDVFLAEVSSSEATAIVVLDTLVRGASGQPRGLVTYIQLDMVRTSGKWLVSGLTSLNLGLPTPGSDTSEPTTTTVAPDG